jgi:hypothetical protein
MAAPVSPAVETVSTVGFQVVNGGYFAGSESLISRDRD